MILLQLCRPSHVVHLRSWFFHCYQPPIMREAVYPARLKMWLCNGQHFKSAYGVRILGVEITVLRTSEVPHVDSK
jgi:hypothetical protein